MGKRKAAPSKRKREEQVSRWWFSDAEFRRVVSDTEAADAAQAAANPPCERMKGRKARR